MCIPANARIKWELLYLLHKAPNQGMETSSVYSSLASKFQDLTQEELTEPYRSDQYGSKWNTAVRSIVAKCKQEGFVSTLTRRGYWSLTDKGHKVVTAPLIIPGID